MRRILIAALASGFALLPAVDATGDSPFGRPVRVSEPDPLPTSSDPSHCGSAAGTGDVNRSGWDTEATLVTDPGDPAHLVTAWTLNWNDALATATSNDGGRSWTEVVPPTTICTIGGNPLYDDSGFDPLLAYAAADADHPNGVAYLLSTVSTTGDRTAVIANRSLNGGLRWTQPIELQAFEFPMYLETTGSVVTDPACPERAYGVWAGGDVLARTRSLYLARTTDHGDTWSAPVPVPGLDFPREGQLMALPSTAGCSELALIATEVPRPDVIVDGGPPRLCGHGPTALKELRSRDGGLTWSLPVDILEAHPTRMVGISVAAGPDAALHVAWRAPAVDAGGVLRGPIMLVSLDPVTGEWGEPRVVEDQPAVEGVGCFAVASAPGLAVGQDGGIALTYYDQRRDADVTDDVLVTDYWLRQSRDGGVTWHDSHIAGPFDLATAPATSPEQPYPADSGWFLGNYQGLIALGSGFASSFVLASPLEGANFELGPQLGDGWSHIPTDIYFARVP